MYSLPSLPGEILDLVFHFLEPYDVKSLRLANRQLHDHVGHTYFRHLALTSNREYLKSVERLLKSTSIARSITKLTFDCRHLLLKNALTRVIFPEDPIALILRNYEHIGDHYSALASLFIDLGDDKQLKDLLTTLMRIISKLPSLNHIIVAERNHYVNFLPPPSHVVRDLKATHPLFAEHVNDKLLGRLIWSHAIPTHLLTQTVIVAAWKTAPAKCKIELRTLYARYGDGGGPTTNGLCDVVHYADLEDSDVLIKRIRRIRRFRRNNGRSPECDYSELIDGSPVISRQMGVLVPNEKLWDS